VGLKFRLLIQKLKQLNKLHLLQMVLTVVLRERSAEDSETAANSSDSEVHFVFLAVASEAQASA